MSVHIDEVSTIIEPTAGERGAGEAAEGGGSAAEVQIEELRPLVRILVAEELERWLRARGECP